MNLSKLRVRWWLVAIAMLSFLSLPVLAQEQAGQEGTKKVPERSEIEKKYTWAVENIFPNKEAWEVEYNEVQKLVNQVPDLKGTLDKGPDQLLHALQFTDDLEPRLDRVYVYTSLLSDEDTRNTEHQAMKQRAFSLYSDYSEKSSWMSPELAAIPQEKVKEWMSSNEKLAVYAHFFDNLWRLRKYILSPREEQLLALTSEVRRTPYGAYNLLTNADIHFPTIKNEKGENIELSDSAFYILMRNPDRKVREAAYRGIVGTYKEYAATNSALLNGVAQSHILTVKARGYDSCLQAALEGSNIPVEVYDTLVKTVNDNLGLLHRYEEIRKRALHLDDGVRAWDLFAPLITGETYHESYEDAVKTILTALQPLGPQYIGIMTKGFESRWIDVYPTRGKRSGAYSSGTYLTQPYILTNFHGGYEDMSTIAHEMGHSMHSYFSRSTQPYVYSEYDIFCAEVASTLNEILLQNYVLEHTTDPKQKLYLIGEFLEQIRGTVFRQTMFSEFEHKFHEMAEADVPLTPASLGDEYRKIMVKYYGPAYTNDELVDNYWIRIPHFYYNFYVYKYATSYCAASTLARRIMEGNKQAVDDYITFLKSGSSAYPIELLKRAGVDMTTPQPIEDAMAIFDKLLTQAEDLLKETGQLASNE